MANLGQQSSQRGEHAAHDALALGRRPFRKSQLQVTHGHTTQAPVQQAHGVAKSNPRRPRQRSWHKAEYSDQQPHRRVLEAMPHSGKRDGNIAHPLFSNGSCRLAVSYQLSALSFWPHSALPATTGDLLAPYNGRLLGARMKNWVNSEKSGNEKTKHCISSLLAA